MSFPGLQALCEAFPDPWEFDQVHPHSFVGWEMPKVSGWIFFFFFNLRIYLFLAVLRLRCCVWAFL